MVKRITLMKISLLIIEFTSLPLLLLASIYLLSGYQMLNPNIRIIPESRRIHVDKFLRILAIILVCLHSIGGLIFLVERSIRRDMLRKIMDAAIIVGLIVLMLFFLLMEVML